MNAPAPSRLFPRSALGLLAAGAGLYGSVLSTNAGAHAGLALLPLLAGGVAGWLLGRPGAPRAPITAGAGGSLRESDLLRTIAESVPDAMLFFSDGGSIRYSNAAARELFFEGRAPEGQNFIRLVSQAAAPLREALLGDSDRLFSVEVEGRRETYHLSRRSFDLGGEPHTLLSVKYMTREIARREVDVLKRVVRVISHEVNNSLAPVTSLVHSARLIAAQPESGPKLERVFSTIEERASHLRVFLDGYAKLARLPRPRPRAVEWPGFLRQLSALYPNVPMPEPPADKGYFDPIQVEQVVINLIKNACEAGDGAAGVELLLGVAADGATELEVRDRGRGFSEEALENALLPLYTTKESGSGMGLALSREIVEAHGGSIGLGNRKDGGASIRVVLPGPVATGNADLLRSRLTLTRA